MIELTDRQRRLAGWTISILFNIGLLVLGAVLLIKPARIQVEVAKASTEIDLAAEPTPAPAITPPAPTAPPTPTPPMPVVTPVPPTPPVPVPPVEPSPFPSEEPTPASAAVKPEDPTPPVPVHPPSPPSQNVSVKTHETKPANSAKASTVKATSNASKGATDAHPDEMHNEPPEYPEASRLAREQGTVTVRVDVTARGQALSVTILQSSGYMRLDHAALEAVRHWNFHPATTAGIPVSCEVDVPIRFQLE